MAISVGQSILFEVLKNMPKFIASWLGNWMLKEEYLTVTSVEANIDTSQKAYPFILFRLKIDSKIPLSFKPKELVAYVYLASVPKGKITYKQEEEWLKVVSIDELKERDTGYLTIIYAPSFDTYKSQYAHKWTIRGILTLSSKLGDISKRFSQDFTIETNQIEGVKKKYVSQMA